jgi:hypothetical protein
MPGRSVGVFGLWEIHGTDQKEKRSRILRASEQYAPTPALQVAKPQAANKGKTFYRGWVGCLLRNPERRDAQRSTLTGVAARFEVRRDGTE